MSFHPRTESPALLALISRSEGKTTVAKVAEAGVEAVKRGLNIKIAEENLL